MTIREKVRETFPRNREREKNFRVKMRQALQSKNEIFRLRKRISKINKEQSILRASLESIYN